MSTLFRKKPAWLSRPKPAATTPEPSSLDVGRSPADDADMFVRSTKNLAQIEEETRLRRERRLRKKSGEIAEEDSDDEGGDVRFTKRRRVSDEQDDAGSGSPVREEESRQRPDATNAMPEVHAAHEDSPPAASKVDSPAKRTRKQRAAKDIETVNIDLDDEDDITPSIEADRLEKPTGHEESYTHLDRRTPASPIAAGASRKLRGIERPPEDTHLENIPSPASQANTSFPERVEEPNLPLQVLILSDAIPDTRPLLCTIRLKQLIDVARKAWCKAQGFDEAFSQKVFLTWRGQRVYKLSTCKGLGVSVEPDGEIHWRQTLVPRSGMETFNEGSDKLVMEAWTTELFEEEKRRKAKGPRTMLQDTETTKDTEPGTSGKSIKVHLKAKDLDEYKLAVRPDTLISKMILAFRKARNIPPDKEVRLAFDGDVLGGDSTVEDAGIEELDSIEVWIK